ncbi:MAG: NADAR family protein [Bacteroidota bacterium]
MSNEQFTYFWKSHSPFSNWYMADFEIDNMRFNCSEQYMMYGKARLFNDEEIALRILKAEKPGAQKDLGRKVRNFQSAVWNEHAKDIVYRANEAKFTQNENLLKRLLKTKGTTLVEASPVDPIWGIGLSAEDPRSRYRMQWRGKNWLGEVLTRLRDDLIAAGLEENLDS